MALPKLIRQIFQHHGSEARSRGRILRQFAQKTGLVYFGSVDQHVDEHEIIRGLTVSTTHRDDHYAVGAFDGYDISLVDRFDVTIDPHGASSEHSWVILQLNLQTDSPLPHIFLQPVNHSNDAYSKFFSANSHLKAVNTLFQGSHSEEFHHRYQVHTASAQALEIEQLFTPSVTQTIAARLWPHAIEIFENKLYVYTTETRLTETLLESCLDSAIWLAQILDQAEEN